MKAIMRNGAGLLGLLLLAASSHAQIWVSPVFKQPYPVAPSPSNTPGYYTMDAYGNWSGPHYYLRPSCQPFNGMLPGKTGQAIMQGYLPHTLLMSKEGLAIGKVPLVGDKSAQANSGQGNPGNGMPQFGMGPGPYGAPNPGMQGPNYAASMPNPAMQVPYYGNVPRSTYPMQSPYAQPQPMPMPMPYGMPQGGMAQPMPYPMPMPYGMPQGGMPYPMPMQYPVAMPMKPNQVAGYYPYYPTQVMRQDPRTGIWQVQNVIPNMPQLPQQPNMNNPPAMGGFQYFGPMQSNEQFNPFSPFNPMQGPQMPRMDDPRMQPMQLPRMEMNPPPQQRQPGCFPTHPFVRSPRDFFMWGENMEDEQRMRNQRPFPVPQ